MDDLLINLAIHSNPKRCFPFPMEYSKDPENYTEEEYNQFIKDIKDRKSKAINILTSVDLGIVKHGEASLNENIVEYEFIYDPLTEIRNSIEYPKRWYLFHGSPIGNWHSILRTGIKNMSGTKFMTTGQAYGPGVYLSDTLHVSMHYGASKVDKQQSTHYFISVVELFVDPKKYEKAKGYFVIQDDKLLFPRYLLHFTKYLDSSGGDLLQFYKKLRDGMYEQKNKERRLQREKDILIKAENFVAELNDTTWLLSVRGILYRCYINNFPFQCPLIQSVNHIVNNVFTNDWFIDEFDKWNARNNIISILEKIKALVVIVDEKVSTEMLVSKQEIKQEIKQDIKQEV